MERRNFSHKNISANYKKLGQKKRPPKKKRGAKKGSPLKKEGGAPKFPKKNF